MSLVLINRCHELRSQGARGRGGISEWIIAREINKGIMEAAECSSHRFFLIPTNPLETRINRINRYCRFHPEQDVVTIEVHCNRVEDLSQWGHFAIAWYDSPSGKAMADFITDELTTVRANTNNHGVCLVDSTRRWIDTSKEHDGRRLAFIEATLCPAVVVECCHLSNAADLHFIQQPENRLKVGRAIGEGLLKFLNTRRVDDGSKPDRLEKVCLD